MNWLLHYYPIFTSLGQFLTAIATFVTVILSSVNMYQIKRTKVHATSAERIGHANAERLDVIRKDVDGRFSEVIAKIPDPNLVKVSPE